MSRIGPGRSRPVTSANRYRENSAPARGETRGRVRRKGSTLGMFLDPRRPFQNLSRDRESHRPPSRAKKKKTLLGFFAPRTPFFSRRFLVCICCRFFARHYAARKTARIARARDVIDLPFVRPVHQPGSWFRRRGQNKKKKLGDPSTRLHAPATRNSSRSLPGVVPVEGSGSRYTRER